MSGRKIFKRLMGIDEALSILRRSVKLEPLGVEEVPVEECFGRVVAEDIICNVDIPPFDRATVDGYAVKSRDVAGAREDSPISLRIIGSIRAGEWPTVEVENGSAVEVSTGSPIPFGADSVVMVEFTKTVGDKLIVYKSTVPGENIAPAGSDIMMGETIVLKGTMLTTPLIGALAAAGYRKIKVYRKPKIGVFSTGLELVEPGGVLGHGKIYDVNTYTLISSLKSMGCTPICYGIVGDDEREIEETLRSALMECDIVLGSGSTSAGVGDVMYRVVPRLGNPGIIVHGLKVKPGKPTIIAVLDGKIFFGLPGYPVSCLTIFSLVVKPVILEVMGLKEVREEFVDARLRSRVLGVRGRVKLQPVALSPLKGELVAFPVPATSGSIGMLSRCDGFVEIPDNVDYVEENSIVKVKLYEKVDFEKRLLFIGSHCPVVEHMLKMLSREYDAKLISVGSTGGFKAALRGESDVSGIHLLDSETGRYNRPMVERFGRGKLLLVSGYYRRQGLIVAPGNPLGIKSIRDIIEGDVRFINRNKGSGTRILFDKLLSETCRELGITVDDAVGKIKGYNVEAKTHSSVALAVKIGRADVGLGIELAARMHGLDFIPITWEEYDFVVNKLKLERECVSKFLSLLKDRDTIEYIKKTPGYRPKENVGDVVE